MARTNVVIATVVYFGMISESIQRVREKMRTVWVAAEITAVFE
jgi:hypothetical protein